MTTSGSRSSLRHLRYSGVDTKRMHRFPKCWRCRMYCIVVCMRFDGCRNVKFGSALPLVTFTSLVGRIPPSRFCQFIKLHLLLWKSLQALLYCFRDCDHHPAEFIIFAWLAVLSIFILFLILLIARTCKIAQTVSDSIQQLFKPLSGLPGCQSPAFSTSHIFLLLVNCGLCILNSLSCPSSFSLHIILDPCLFLCIVQNVPFLSSPCREVHFWITSYAMHLGLGLIQLPRRSCLHSLDDVIVWIELSICSTCQLEVVKSSVSDHWP